ELNTTSRQYVSTLHIKTVCFNTYQETDAE
ncbi:MAG: hypothetical protein ACI9UR_002372, partial [Bacteroidia bacterium]